MNTLFDKLLLCVIRRRLRSRPDFYSEVGRAVLDHVARKKEAETEARDNAAHEAVRVLAKRIETQRFVTDTMGYTSPSEIQ